METTWLLTWGSPLPFLPGSSCRAWKCVGLSPVTPVSGGAWEPWVSFSINTCDKISTAEVGVSSIHGVCVWGGVYVAARPVWHDSHDRQ